MPVDVEIGPDWGSTAITTEADSGDLAVVAKGREYTVHAAIGGPPASAAVLATGETRAGGVFTTDARGRPPFARFTLDDIDDTPAYIYFHAVDDGPSEGWYRYPVYAGTSSSSGGGSGSGLPAGAAEVLPASLPTQAIRWGWADTDLAAGVTSQGARVREPVDVTALAGYLVGDLATVDTRIEWVFRPDGAAEIPVGSVIIRAGESWDENLITPVRLPTAGFLVPTLAQAPAAGSAGATAATRVATTAASTGTGVASASTPFSAPLPAGGAAGDIVQVEISCQAPEPSMGSAWTRVAASSSTGTTPQSRTYVFWAPWAADLDMAVTLTAWVSGTTTIASTPIRATTTILRGAPGTNPIPVSIATAPANNSGGTVTIPATVTPSAVDIVIIAVGWRANAGVSGQTAAGPGTELADAMTTRDAASNTNVGQAAYVLAGGYAAGATIPAQTVTISGGTGDAGTLSTSAVMFGVRRTPGTSAPKRIEGEVVLRAVPLLESARTAG